MKVRRLWIEKILWQLICKEFVNPFSVGKRKVEVLKKS